MRKFEAAKAAKLFISERYLVHAWPCAPLRRGGAQ
jgi:hypothetical protein